MEVVSSIGELRERLEYRRRVDAIVGLVPTMGALHDGHASLIRAAAAKNTTVVTTIFVNPLQFAPTEDLGAYPRDITGDRAIAEAAGATLLFTPTPEEMYPLGPRDVLTTVSVRALSDGLDGAHRPGHFDGVATVVAKLFAIVGPCRAYFGEKDFQQLAVVRRMALDLSYPVAVIGCPIVRESNGLAMSSRNRYLDNEERARAAVLHRSLLAGAGAIADGEHDTATVCARMESVLAQEPTVAVEYAAAVDATTLTTSPTLNGDVRLLVAARIGRARLIDNLGVHVS